MKKSILLFSLILIAALISAQDCSDLFFSEYLEGSGNNKGVEIFNPTDKIIDLSKYWVVRYSNGSSTYAAGGYTQLEGFLEPYKTFVLVNGQKVTNEFSPACDPAMQALADMLDHDYPAPTYMNGNDAIALVKSETKILDQAVAIDLIGKIGLGALIEEEVGWSNIKDTTVTYRVDSVTETQGKVINYIVQDSDINGQNFGPFWLSWTRNHTLVRKPSVKEGVKMNPAAFVVDIEWDTVPGGENKWDSLNAHTCECTPTTSVRELNNAGQSYLFPNPVSTGIMTLYSTRDVRSYEILGITGHLIRREASFAPQKEIIISISDLNPGMYFVRATFSERQESVVFKFLKQ
jgi:hypothetical protein